MDTQEITLTQDSSDGLYTQLLRGRYVTSINDGCITLDNGLILTIEGNEGCMACANGWYHLDRIYKQGSSHARIMSAHVEYSQDDNYSAGCYIYTIFVMVDGNPTQLPLATIRGDDGPGGYGTGFTLTATIVSPSNIQQRESFLHLFAYSFGLQSYGKPRRITGPLAQKFLKAVTTKPDCAPYKSGTWKVGKTNAYLFWHTDTEGGVSFVLRNFSNGFSAYLEKLQAFTEQIYAHDTEIKTYITGYALKGTTATVNGTRVPATDLLPSEIRGEHRLDGKLVPTFHYINMVGVRVLKHRGGERGYITIISRTQNVWAITPQEDTTL
jgi:hypothetical protein